MSSKDQKNNMKKLLLSLLCAGSSTMANGNHSIFHPGTSIELAGGVANMTGSLISNTPTPETTPQIWRLSVQYDSSSLNKNITVQTSMPGGYQANWNKMTPAPNQSAFALECNLHHILTRNLFNSLAVGLYGGFGYNRGSRSSIISEFFNNTVYNNKATISLDNSESSGLIPFAAYTMKTLEEQSGKNGLIIKIEESSGASPTNQAIKNKNFNLPMAKAIVSSSLTFQAGTRIGPVIGQAFPHLRLGWAIHQFRIHMTHQFPPYSRIGNIDTSGGGAQGVLMQTNLTAANLQAAFARNRAGCAHSHSSHTQSSHTQSSHTPPKPPKPPTPPKPPKPPKPPTPPTPPTPPKPPGPIPRIAPAVLEKEGTLKPVHMLPHKRSDQFVLKSGYGNASNGMSSFNVEADQNLGNIDAFYDPNNRIKVASRSGWSNALTVGFGVDWALPRMTLGFYYQASIFQRASFDKWNKDMTAGMTGSVLDLKGEKVVTAHYDGSAQNTDRKLTALYDKVTPELSIAPIMHTIMFSAKYVLRKP